MAARHGLLALIFAAAASAAAPAAFAQTNDPNLSQEDLDCLARQRAGGPDCLSDGAGEAAAPDAVIFPALIADLFPAPDAGEPVPAEPSAPQDPDDLPATVPVPDSSPRATAPADPPAVAQPVAPPPPTVPPIVSLAAAPPTVAPQAITGAFVPDEVLVTVDGDAAAVAEIAAAFGLEVRSQRTSTLLGSTLVRFGIPDGRPVGVVLAQIAGDGRSTRRAPNSIYDLQQAAGAVNYAFQRIALAPDAASGADVRVAVIDTAVDDTHPALKGVLAGLFDAMPGVEVTARDHATSVVGLIAGVGPQHGMAPGAAIYHARAFEAGKSNTDIVLAALDWAAEQDVRVINMSFVGPPNDLLKAACTAAHERGILLVAAAGNNGPKAPYGYPAAYDGVIAVTATDASDALMPQANRGPYVFMSAPGVDMVAPVGGGSDLVTGTSFAAAIVSGAIANLLHAAPDRSAEQVEQALAATAKDLGRAGRDNDFGFGLLDTAAAAKAK